MKPGIGKKNKTVYLFGAGAAISWGGPTTDFLTGLVLKAGFNCKDGKTKVTQKIYDVLCEFFPKSEINFEAILNVIEELLVYNSSRDYLHTNSILRPFLDSRNFLDDIFNFRINGELKHGFNLIIDGHGLESNKRAYQNQSVKQFYLQLLYANILTSISIEISNYSYHSSSISEVFSEKNKELNESFYRWIKNEIDSEASVRLYTLNYDRIFSVILKKNGINIFEGADSGHELAPEEKIPFDIVRIASDFKSNIHYNLHGCAYWDIQDRNVYQLPSVEFSLTGYPNLTSNRPEQPLVQMERGKLMNPTNIITGYQKTQKTAISPFRQMQSAFDRDCLEADNVIIVGYSFGDAHLNETLRMVLLHNTDANFSIIDPNFRKNKTDEKIGIELLSNSHIPISPTNITENSCSFLEGKVIVYEEYFDEYLKSNNV